MSQKLSLIKYYKLVPEALTGDKKYLEIVSSYMTLNNYTWSGLSTQSKRVIAQSGVLASESSGDQIDFCYLNTVFELYSSYHFGQVVEAA